MADGPPVKPAADGQRRGAPGGAPPADAAPRGQRGGQGAAGPPAGRGGAPLTINADGTPLIAAIDWLARESGDRSSRFYQKVEGRFAIPESTTLKSAEIRVLAVPGGQVKLSRTINIP